MGARAERHQEVEEICQTEGCDEIARCVGLCGACYQGVRSNRLKSTKDLMRYVKKVRRISARTKFLTGTVRSAKVVSIHTRRRAR